MKAFVIVGKDADIKWRKWFEDLYPKVFTLSLGGKKEILSNIPVINNKEGEGL